MTNSYDDNRDHEPEARDVPGMPSWALAPEPQPFVETPTVSALYASLIGAMAELENVSTDGEAKAGSYSYKYTSLGAIMKIVRPVLGRHDLGLIQGPMIEPASITVATRVIHSSGEWIETRVTMPTGRSATAQDIGSALTYGRRYGLSALLGIATEADDDGHAATSSTRSGDSGSSRQSTPATPPADPFEGDGERFSPSGELLVSRADYQAVLDGVGAMTVAQRRDVAAWRDEQKIKVTPLSLTADSAAELLAYIASVGDDSPALIPVVDETAAGDVSAAPEVEPAATVAEPRRGRKTPTRAVSSGSSEPEPEPPDSYESE